jgi:hypothetical protein
LQRIEIERRQVIHQASRSIIMGTKLSALRAEKALEVGFSSSLLHDIKLYCRGQVTCGGFNALLIRIEFSFTQEDARSSRCGFSLGPRGVGTTPKVVFMRRFA